MIILLILLIPQVVADEALERAGKTAKGRSPLSARYREQDTSE